MQVNLKQLGFLAILATSFFACSNNGSFNGKQGTIKLAGQQSTGEAIQKTAASPATEGTQAPTTTGDPKATITPQETGTVSTSPTTIPGSTDPSTIATATATGEPAASPTGEPTLTPPLGKSCTLKGQTITDTQTITGYLEYSPMYPLTCTSETRTCNDGALSGTFTNTECFPLGLGTIPFAAQICDAGSPTLGRGAEACWGWWDYGSCGDGVRDWDPRMCGADGIAANGRHGEGEISAINCIIPASKCLSGKAKAATYSTPGDSCLIKKWVYQCE